MSVRMDGETLATLYAAALSGTAHPADVCRLVDEVLYLQTQQVRPTAAVATDTFIPDDGKGTVAAIIDGLKSGKVFYGPRVPVPVGPGHGPRPTTPVELWKEGSDPSPVVHSKLQTIVEQLRRDCASTTGDEVIEVTVPVRYDWQGRPMVPTTPGNPEGVVTDNGPYRYLTADEQRGLEGTVSPPKNDSAGCAFKCGDRVVCRTGTWCEGLVGTVRMTDVTSTDGIHGCQVVLDGVFGYTVVASDELECHTDPESPIVVEGN